MSKVQDCGSSEPNFTQAIAARARNGQAIALFFSKSTLHSVSFVERLHSIYGGAAVVKDALDTIVEAQGGISKVAKRVDMDPQLLSKFLSNEDTPLIDALGIVLKALGCQLSIKPLEYGNSNLETDAGQRAHVAENPASLQ